MGLINLSQDGARGTAWHCHHFTDSLIRRLLSATKAIDCFLFVLSPRAIHLGGHLDAGKHTCIHTCIRTYMHSCIHTYWVTIRYLEYPTQCLHRFALWGLWLQHQSLFFEVLSKHVKCVFKIYRIPRSLFYKVSGDNHFKVCFNQVSLHGITSHTHNTKE